jgi:D-2-hydroxyacid dehydrogenase (NADP+)
MTNLLGKIRQGTKAALVGTMPSPWHRTGVTRVVIDASDGFELPLWTAALDSVLPAWRDSIELLEVKGGLALDRAAREADVCSTMAPAAAWFEYQRLKWINVLTAGLDVTGLPEPRTGLCVTTSRGIAARGMAEHALMLMLALLKQLPASCQDQAAWKWSQEGKLGPSRELPDLMAAVVGLGSAGSEIARLCKALGMRVTGVRRNPVDSYPLCDELWPLAELAGLLPRADVLFLALPLNAKTRDLIAGKELAMMKPGAILINVARGGLVNEIALATALREGRLGGAGLDVLAAEPPVADSPLRNCPNLIVTPHVAGNVHRYRAQIASRFARNVAAFLDGRDLEGTLPRDYWAGRGHAP